jgi:hypothetical protein
VTNTRIPKVGEKGWCGRADVTTLTDASPRYIRGAPVDILGVDGNEVWVRYVYHDGGSWMARVGQLFPPETEPIGYANIYPWVDYVDIDVARIGAQSPSREIVDNQATDDRIAVLVWWADGNVTVEATP